MTETHSVTPRSGPWAASVAPAESPSAAAAAPRLPAPARDQTEVAHPFAATIPAPKMSPPTTVATGVTGGRGTTSAPSAASPLTRMS